jgi:hypothetical protein
VNKKNKQIALPERKKGRKKWTPQSGGHRKNKTDKIG